MMVWVLCWEYSDKSGHGIVRIYDNNQRANDDLDMLNAQDSARTYTLESYYVVEGR